VEKGYRRERTRDNMRKIRLSVAEDGHKSKNAGNFLSLEKTRK
jgi:hypothetical protein